MDMPSYVIAIQRCVKGKQHAGRKILYAYDHKKNSPPGKLLRMILNRCRIRISAPVAESKLLDYKSSLRSS